METVLQNDQNPDKPSFYKNSGNHPQKREEFYEDLNNTIKSISNRKAIIITGDFNAKTV